MAKKKTKRKSTGTLDHDIYIYIAAIFLIAITVIGFKQFGPIGIFLTRVIQYLFGTYYGVVYGLILITAVYMFFYCHRPVFSSRLFVATALLFTAFLLWAATPESATVTGFDVLSQYIDHTDAILNGSYPAQGGIIGAFLYSLSSALFSRNGTFVIIGALLVLAMVILCDFRKILAFFQRFWLKLTEEKPKEVKPVKKSTVVLEDYTKQEPEKTKKKSVFINVEENKTAPVPEEKPEPVKTTSAATVKDDGKYVCPSADLLEKVSNKKSSQLNIKAADDKGKRLIELLGEFGINSTLIGRSIGPSVTKFEIKPESNVKISKIAAIQDNIKMELAAKSIRIEAPIPGRSAVGVEVPNVEMTTVHMSEMITAVPRDAQDKKLLFGLGKDLMGKPVFCQLDKMPHLLIAGATGSGKSVCVNGIITTLLLRTSPSEVKMLLVDPKKVEFTQYKEVPHLIGPVISDSSEASRALKVIVDYMENRYDIFAKVGVRNIATYNDFVKQHPEDKLAAMPRIVVIIDELADLMATVGKEVEQSIQRITQLARAAGIHLIVATQRPSTDVITGIIKANIPSRIAFAVSSGIDSRTIIDTVGAEKLLGNGDMLYWPIGEPTAIRLQGVYVSDDEVNKIAAAAAAQQKPIYDDAFLRLEELDNDENGFMNDTSADPIYDEVVQFVAEVQKASTSLLQRKFGIGYNRAARLIDVMEQRGIIGPAQGSKPREVFVSNNKEEEE